MYTLFLSYGTGMHQDEVEFAVRCLRHRSGMPDHRRVLIYTDTPDRFADLAVTVVEITSSQWQLWGGPQNFNHRRKICAIQHALEHFDAPVLLLDGDTWLRRPLKQLTERIRPGHGVMHIREGRICAVQSPLYRNLHSLLTSDAAAAIPVTADSWMWNAGVIGLHPEQLDLIPEVLDLTDELCKISALHILEQLAFSWVLQKRIQLREAADVIFHYWPPYLHKPFREKLSQIMSQASELPDLERDAWLWRHRPQPTVLRRCKVLCKWGLQGLGVLKGHSRSNEW